MRILVLIVLILTSRSAFSESDSYINGISINSDLAEIIEAFGTPLESKEALDWFDYVHRYDRFEIYAYGDGTLVGGASEEVGVCIGIDVCVGEEFAAGSLERAPSYIAARYSHIFENRGCPYYVNVLEGKVVRVAILCRPD